MSLLTKTFQLSRSESFFRILEEPQNDMDISDDENQTSKKRKQDEIDGESNSLTNPILTKIEKQVLKQSRIVSQKYNNDLKSLYKLDTQTTKIVAHFNQGTLPSSLKFKSIVNQYPTSFKNRDGHIRDEQRIFLTALHNIVDARAKFYIAEFDGFQKYLQQQYSPEKVKLELTDFANQQIPTGTTFEHDEISTIVEKVFAGFITHNEITLAKFENEKSNQNPVDIPSDGEEDEVITQKQLPVLNNKANINKNTSSNTNTNTNTNTNNTTKNTNNTPNKNTAKQTLSLEEQFKRIVIQLDDVTAELKLSRKQQNRSEYHNNSSDHNSNYRGRSRDRKAHDNRDTNTTNNTNNTTKKHPAPSEFSHEERQQSVAKDKFASKRQSQSSKYNNDSQSPPPRYHQPNNRFNSGERERSRSANRHPRGRDV
jgi:hypothetical protein